MDCSCNEKVNMGGYRRFFAEKIQDYVEISGDEFSHAVNTLRLGVGEKVILFDNSGFDYVCTINNIAKKSMTVCVDEKIVNENECKNDITLICGYLKGDKTEFVVQKAVELGVKEIVVFSSEFSSAYMNDNKLARLNKVSMEAAKQCGRSIAPKVIYVDNFASALECGKKHKNRLFAYENTENYTTHISDVKGDVAIVVGSEGGFSKKEVELALGCDYKVITLGKRILRAETAALCAISVVMYCLGELE